MMMQYFLDFGPMFEDGILSNYPPSVAGRPAYPSLVSKVDADGNELAGVRLPPVEAPGRRMRRPEALRMNTIVIAWLSFDDNQTWLDRAEVSYLHMT
jgi:hypothetical protein